MEVGIYIHIPFCKKKCYYCDFISLENSEDINKIYIERLLDEIESYRERLRKSNIITIYIGGGTPSLLESKYISMIIKKLKSSFNIDENVEITIEGNPESLNEQKLLDYIDLGINRLSIGLQTHCNKILKSIGRLHSFEEFKNIVLLSKKIGFNNINTDLIFALPMQNMDVLKRTLKEVIDLKIHHISAYGLIINENTKLQNMIENKELIEVDEDLEVDMYYFIVDFLKQNGFNHYEISNFCRENKFSKHNTIYWKNKDYIGLGLGAHSSFQNKRWENTSNIKKYLSLNNIVINEEIIDGTEKLKEHLILGLRMTDGINIRKIETALNQSLSSIQKENIKKHIKSGLLLKDNENIKFTKKGLYLSNKVFRDLI